MRSNQRRADLFKCAPLKQPARRHFVTYSEEREKEGKKERNCAATLLGIRNYADDAQVRLSDWQGCGADILAGVVVKLGSGRVHF